MVERGKAVVLGASWEEQSPLCQWYVWAQQYYGYLIANSAALRKSKAAMVCVDGQNEENGSRARDLSVYDPQIHPLSPVLDLIHVLKKWHLRLSQTLEKML